MARVTTVDEQFTMSEPLLPYKDNLTYNYGLSAPGTYCLHGKCSDQEFSETTKLYPSVVLCPLCLLAVSYATKICDHQCLG
jgi:hypothetical protein